MNLEELKTRFLQVRTSMNRVRDEQCTAGFMPSPDYVKPIGAYADDDSPVHNSEIHDDASLVNH